MHEQLHSQPPESVSVSFGDIEEEACMRTDVLCRKEEAATASTAGLSPRSSPCFFCYMLTSSVCGATYIGASKDPWRRLRQHNGQLCGGAKATRKKRPWRLHIVVGGFCDWRETLRFEWAWKHGTCRRRVTRGVPERTRRSSELVNAYPHLAMQATGSSAVHEEKENDEE